MVNAPDLFRQQLLAAIPRLRRYARTLVFEAMQADDLVQTALERALTHWHQFDQRRDLVVWLLSIAHNAHLDHHRREARLCIVDPQALAEVQDAGAKGGGIDVGLRLDLVAALKRLPKEQAETLVLVSVEQLTYAECAEVLGIPIGTVMSRLARARVALRRILEGPEETSAPPRAATAALKRVV